MVLTSSLLFAACARSAIDELEDASFAIVDGGDGPENDAEPAGEEEAGAGPGMDASAPPAHDAGTPAQDAAQDAGGMGAMDSATPSEAGAADAGAADAAARDAASDAARDAAPVDASPPIDTAPPAPKCTAGNYRGVFMGKVVVVLFGLEVTEIALTGTITLTAAAEPGTQRFTVTNGKVEGQDNSGNPITATVTGNLNCATGTVENGELIDGLYTNFVIGAVTFTGSVTGTYTNTPPYASGSWQTETASTTLLQSAMGTWNVSLVP